MKTLVLFIAVFLLALPSVQSQATQENELFWYVKEEPLYFFKQTDVFSFRIESRLQYKNNFSVDVVDTIIFRPSGKTYNLVLFSTKSSASERNAVINTIKSDPDFEREHPSFTLKPELPQSKDKWCIVLDELLIRYKLSTSEAQIDSFVKYRDLILVHTSPLDLHSYFGYDIGDVGGERDAIELAKDIFLNDSIIQECHPGRGEFINR